MYHFRGPKIFPDVQNFSEHQTTFPYITKLTTKLTYFVPVLLIITQIVRLWSEYCPTAFVCPTNWGLFGFLISHSSPDLCWAFARLFDFLIFLGGQLPPCPSPQSRTPMICVIAHIHDNSSSSILELLSFCTYSGSPSPCSSSNQSLSQ